EQRLGGVDDVLRRLRHGGIERVDGSADHQLDLGGISSVDVVEVVVRVLGGLGELAELAALRGGVSGATIAAAGTDAENDDSGDDQRFPHRGTFRYSPR